jgi:hypothetical protein
MPPHRDTASGGNAALAQLPFINQTTVPNRQRQASLELDPLDGKHPLPLEVC